MATQQLCGFPWWADGMTWDGQVSRRFDSGPSVIDAGFSRTALTPISGVYPAQGANLRVTPGSGLTVAVAAGYAMVASTTSGQGGYRFGLMATGTLTVAANATGSTRLDLVVAQVHDLGTSSSFADVNIITGTTSLPVTPSGAIPLAQVSVANGASSLSSGDITDLRGFVVAPGGILHLPTAAKAPAAPVSQFMWQVDAGQLVQGGGTAGQVTPYQQGGAVYFTRVTSPASWTVPASSHTTIATLSVTGDGRTDFEITYGIPELTTPDADGTATVGLYVDGARRDAVYAALNGKAGSTSAQASATYYTSSGAGTTLSKGTHTVSLIVSATFIQPVVAFAPATIRAAAVAL